jgi:ADP-heptose:LPS heptosyltransferase
VTRWEHPGTLAAPPIEWAALRRILVVRPDNVGDVVMCGPALRSLRRAAPSARIDVLASPAGAAVVPLLPWVDDTVVASVSWQQLDPTAVTGEDDSVLIRRIAARHYDAAVVLTSFSQSPWPAAYLCRLAGVPVRVGMSKEFGGSGLTHWVPAPADDMHQVDRALHMLSRVGVAPAGAGLALAVPEAARTAARTALNRAGLPPGERYALLLPGASCRSRRYPASRLAACARILTHAGLRTVVAGTAREATLVAEVARSDPRIVAVSGELDVPGLAAAVDHAAVVVCNNSAGAHLASAFGTPVVVLFAGTEQVRQYQPRFTPAAVMTVPTACAPCRQLRCPYGSECLDIPPAGVAGEALRLAAVTA